MGNIAIQPRRPGSETLFRVRGIVQGVGFRPFVHRLATRLQLRGWVRNDGQGVLIRAAGDTGSIEVLVRSLESEAPPAARVQSIVQVDPVSAPDLPGEGFLILESGPASAAPDAAVPPDLALCADCRRELLDPRDRRYRYPFINCTQCGPRYSILEALPYDRPKTTMRAFRMCPTCQAEYDNPADRRFHAQPNACPVCGPRARFVDSLSRAEGEAALVRAVAVLASGGLLAVKGVGGYHLMADAANAAAVAELRKRKHRDEKPFAVMFADIRAVREAAETTPEAETLLASPAAPIVLLRRRTGDRLAEGIAPNNPWVGAFLAYAPLQVLLLEAFGRPVVATSANLAEEPLCTEEAEAETRLAGIADGFLHHNRPIAHPVDDSVARLSSAGPILLRRARGYAPAPLRLPGRLDGQWLCVGAEMKSVLAVASGDQVVLSPHIGDLGSAAAFDVFRRTADMLGGIYSSRFTGVVRDRHPGYASTHYANETGLPRVTVQHHLAHVLACLLENGRDADDVLGVAWDGTGYGEDGTIWGGEFILLRNRVATRFARLRQFRLAGGEAAIRDGRRSALGLVQACGSPRFGELAREFGFREAEARLLQAMLSRDLNSPVTSSAGRLFDAVAALTGAGGRNHFEGQAAISLEAAAAAATGRGMFELPLRSVPPGNGASFELDWEPLLHALLAARAGNRPAGELSLAFHRGLAAAIVAVAQEAGAKTVALTGGCFQNALLLDLAMAALRSAGFEVVVHHELPPNDGNIAAGQALGALWGLTSVQIP